MLPTLPTTRQQECSPTPLEHDLQDTMKTRLWLDEHIWFYQLLRSDNNISATFHFPDLIGACIALCREQDEAGTSVLRQARRNMAERAQGRCQAPAS